MGKGYAVIFELYYLNKLKYLLLMKKSARVLISGCVMVFFTACGSGSQEQSSTPENNTAEATAMAGQSGVVDETSEKNVVQVAVSSKDHTTLVAAVQAAELVDALSNAGPFTVFAPVNAAFDKLPAGTVDGLLKPESKDALQDILQYHVSVGVYNAEQFTDGQSLGQVNGSNISIALADGKIKVNGKATVLASIKASNGVIHVIDEVLLPPKPAN
jgi:uncharacterized surface protein with fasciclin (FAS1) repeats